MEWSHMADVRALVILVRAVLVIEDVCLQLTIATCLFFSLETYTSKYW